MAVVVARPLDSYLRGFTWLRRDSLRLLAMLLCVTAVHLCISFPLSFYAGHVLEHRFHLSTLSFRGWLWRYVKRNGLAVALGMPLVLGLFWLIWTTHGWWWLVAAGAFFLVSMLLGQLMPVLILPLFYKIEKLDAPELVQRIARLAEGTGLSIQGVYRMALSDETVKANAMLAGLGRTPPRPHGRYSAGRLYAGRDRGHLRPRDRPPCVPSHPQNDFHGHHLQCGRLLGLRPRVAARRRSGRGAGSTMRPFPSGAAVDHAHPRRLYDAFGAAAKRSAAVTSGKAIATLWSGPA